MSSVDESFEIGTWRADPAANELIGVGGPVRIAPKAMAVLAMLQAERGRVLTRIQLCDRVGLSDEGLSRTVSELRKVLEDDPRSPAWLQTIPRRGYRLNSSASPGTQRDRTRTAWLAALAVAALAVATILASAWFATRPGSSAVPDYEQRRLTAFEGRAVAPRLENGTAVFERFDADGKALGLWRIDLETLSLTALDVDDRVRRRLVVNGEIVARMEAREGRCRILVSEVTLDCRDAAGDMDVHPDRGWIAFEDVDGGIARIAMDGSGLRRLTAPPPGLIDRDPRFSRDGSQIAFVRGDDVGAELHRVSADGGAADALTDDGQMVFGHDWLDRDRLVFSSDRAGLRELWLLPAMDRQPVALGGTWAMGLDADDDRVVFERPVYRADILEIDDNGDRALVDSARYDNHPRLSPDGRHLAFLSNRTGRTAVWIARADGSDQRVVVEDPAVRLTRPRWINAEGIVFAAFGSTGSEIWQTDLDGNIRVVVDRRWSPLEAAGSDDRLWFIGRDDAGPAVFERLADGTIDRRHALDARQIEVDGLDRLYVELTGRSGIYRPELDLANPIARVLRPRAWVVNGNHLAWVGSRGVIRRRLSDGAETMMTSLAPDVVGHGLEISADGERLLIARTTGVQTDLFELRFD